MDPDLPVLHGRPEEFHVPFVGERIAVTVQATDDLLAFVLGQKLGSRRVVLHDKVGDNGHNEGDETLEDEDPRPSAKPCHTIHLTDATSQKTAESASRSRS
jgi:hypothetical protein